MNGFKYLQCKKRKLCLMLVAIVFELFILKLLSYAKEYNAANVSILHIHRHGTYNHILMNNSWILLFNLLNHRLENARLETKNKLLLHFRTTAWYDFSDYYLAFFSRNLNGYNDKNFLDKVQQLEHVTTIIHNGSIYEDGGSITTTTKIESVSSFKYPEIYQSGITEWQCSKEAENSKNKLPSAECLNGTNQKLHFIVVPDTLLEVYSKTPSVYIQVIMHGKVNPEGVVRIGDVNIISDQCYLPERGIKVYGWRTKYSEVFVISQYWGEGIFHFSIEDFPRISPYIQFLTNNPEVKIHVVSITKQVQNYFWLIGFDDDRLVTGSIESDIVYLPQGGGCGKLNQPNGIAMNRIYHQLIERIDGFKAQDTQKYIIIIQRSKRRWIAESIHNKLVQELEIISVKYGLKLLVYSDNPLPSFKHTLLLFYKAVVVVGPHGAGFSNMMFSKPKTFIVEIMCKTYMNYCNRSFTTLGMHYHAVISSTDSCTNMVVNVGIVTTLTTDYLQHYNYTDIQNSVNV